MSEKSVTEVIRIGPVTIFTLLIILCLATLSVLTLTTSRAEYASASKEDASVQSTYDVERQGQEFTAQADEQLLLARASGADRATALSALRAHFGTTVTTSGSTVTATFDSNTRELTVQLDIRDDLTYRISQWTVTTNSLTDEQLNLWSGSGSTAQR